MDSPAELCTLESAKKIMSDVINFLLGRSLGANTTTTTTTTAATTATDITSPTAAASEALPERKNFHTIKVCHG
ncbi:hypothetical protein Scep_019308 [Stephania cephalantha]|uniref:Uncharacterized protein n=1 Tax=Stephania cephalantha TaxID=152367 RepID=A0AAP0NMS2_9MAGN